MKRKVYYFIEFNQGFIKFIYTLIILNVISLIIGSYKEIREMNTEYLDAFEIFSVAVFTLEYVLRLSTADLNESSARGSFRKRLKFIFSTYKLVDLIAILPFYLPLIFPFDLRVIRILRIMRLIRIFKLGRYSKSLKQSTAFYVRPDPTWESPYLSLLLCSCWPPPSCTT